MNYFDRSICIGSKFTCFITATCDDGTPDVMSKWHLFAKKILLTKKLTCDESKYVMYGHFLTVLTCLTKPGTYL